MQLEGNTQEIELTCTHAIVDCLYAAAIAICFGEESRCLLVRERAQPDESTQSRNRCVPSSGFWEESPCALVRERERRGIGWTVERERRGIRGRARIGELESRFGRIGQCKMDGQECSNKRAVVELELLKEDTNVYKLIGPVLVKQDLVEVNANVKKRIEYISSLGTHYSWWRTRFGKKTYL
ncbi:hypothetical protein Droror1_Dr00026617 [Drosera rotundifolia]